jgi:DNA primase
MSLLEALILFINMDSDSFIRKYCLDRFQSNYRLQSDDTELVVPSIFLDNDYKRHMSINTETGLWRCFKTGESGNFLKLYAILENCSYREAYEKFVFEDFMQGYKTPRKFEEFDSSKVESNLDESQHFELVEDHEFVKSRCVEKFKFYIAKSGKYKGRLIIPFINRNNKLFYFQGRALNNEKPKYLNCKNLKSSQVLYPFDYGSQEPLYITEGVFDCLSLQAVGLNATTTLSCFTSREQMLQLSQYLGPLVCAFDSDEAGITGRKKFMNLAHWVRRDDLLTVVPPEPYKDWNEILIKKGPTFLREEAEKTQKLNPLHLQFLAYDKGHVI